MLFYGLRHEYSLEGILNYIAWKEKMEVVLEDNGMKEFIDNDIPKPPIIDTQDLAKWKKCMEKKRRIRLEGFQAHIVSNLHGKDTPYAMWKSLI